MTATHAFKIEPDSPQAWRSAFLALKPSVVPCPGMTATKWQTVHAAAIDFLDRFAGDAAALGWTTQQLFGVHPELGVIRADFCGAMVLSGETVSAVEQDCICFVRTHYRRDVPGMMVGVPIWSFRR